jgi:hypothetical protein
LQDIRRDMPSSSTFTMLDQASEGGAKRRGDVKFIVTGAIFAAVF